MKIDRQFELKPGETRQLPIVLKPGKGQPRGTYLSAIRLSALAPSTTDTSVQNRIALYAWPSSCTTVMLLAALAT